MKENETNVPKLSKLLRLALPTIRKAIGVLRDKGLVIQRGKARKITYSLNLSWVSDEVDFFSGLGACNL